MNRRELSAEPALFPARKPGLALRRDKLRARWRRWRQPDVATLNGVRIAIDQSRFSDKIIERIHDGGSEAGECAARARARAG